jgi:hypothetical protein
MSSCMSHGYPVLVTRLKLEDGGGFVAYIPQLGNNCFYGQGDSPQEAIEDLDLKYPELRQLFEEERDLVFPEPMDWELLQSLIPEEQQLREKDADPGRFGMTVEQFLEARRAIGKFRFMLALSPEVSSVQAHGMILSYIADVYVKPGEGDENELKVYDLKAQVYSEAEGSNFYLNVAVLPEEEAADACDSG